MAAYYPDTPSKDEQQSMKNLINSFAQFYPCRHCAEDFQKEVKQNPPM